MDQCNKSKSSVGKFEGLYSSVENRGVVWQSLKRYSRVQPVQFAVCPLCGGGVYLLIPSHLDTRPHR